MTSLFVEIHYTIITMTFQDSKNTSIVLMGKELKKELKRPVTDVILQNSISNVNFLLQSSIYFFITMPICNKWKFF